MLHADGRVEERAAPSAVDPAYSAQLSAFMAVAAGGGREAVARNGLVGGEEAARTMALLDAARESARDGHRVTLPAS